MIRNEASQNQVNAAAPRENTWLSANAGSGKTRVLTDRVARLLLGGADPQNILCLTYTNAAATEMQNRLFQRLGTWSMMPDDALRDSLADLGETGPFPADYLAKARALFAHAVETPGGLKIQTIHSFCAGVLRRFPLEAGISPQFTEMDERAASDLRAEVLDELAEGEAAEVFRTFLQHFTGADLDQITGEIARHADQFAQPPDSARIGQVVGASPGVDLAHILARVFDPAHVATLRQLQQVCLQGSASDMKAAEKLAQINFGAPGHADIEALEGLVLFGPKAADPFGPKVGKLPTKATAQAHPALIAELDPLMELVGTLRPQRLAAMAAEKAFALHGFAHHFVTAYAAAKLRRGVVDYDDLIKKTNQLLGDRAVAQWVLYRLDGGIDHVLVDEAQDTSPSQWAVINHLTQEFTAGDGTDAHDQRTLFVVGDKKQSIYSFQGADPDEFDRMLDQFRDRFQQAGLGLQDRKLSHSFRSSQAILRVVDNTFAGHRNAGLETLVSHMAFKSELPGRVDLWPAIEPVKQDDTGRKWFEPVDHLGVRHHDVILADQIAAQIKYMIKNEWLPEEDSVTKTTYRRRPSEGDFLILVQRRSELFSQIIRACKAEGLEIAGADRLRIGAELAVKDIVATLRFLALPEDDLSLAAALKSPLFGWSEQDLFTLAAGRTKSEYLWARLRDSTTQFATRAVLDDLRKQADFLRPFELIERLLTRHDGRRKLLARLGNEAEDGIDALLSQALAYESTEAASLTGFLGWLEDDTLEIKRQMNANDDKVRVMSVHGAKGLEAPIVILPETQKRRIDLRNDLMPVDDQVIWKPKADDLPPRLAAARADMIAAQQRERMRLLYVAMTRAEKWLIVAAAGEVGQGDDSWYSIVADGMESSGAVAARTGSIDHQRVAHLDWEQLEDREVPKASPPKVVEPAFERAPTEPKARTLSPSVDLGGAKVVAAETTDPDDSDALARGSLVHLLLEHLPGSPLHERWDLGQRILAAFRDPPADAVDLLDSLIRLTQDPALAFIFAEDALTEVPVSASLDALGGQRIHGTIDRLVVSESTVLAVDFKTNRLVPDHPTKTPEGILRQMGAYHAALAQIYPNHAIKTAILWTETGNLMYLSDADVSQALNRVTAP